MRRRSIQWVNTPVLMEALLRYDQGQLPKPMKLWLEKLLELNPKNKTTLMGKTPHP
tara:strand:+ start:104 stop:271 length:168 start_codon:yes stop_codon:yes gene_type:complete